MAAIHDLINQALTISTADDCIVIASEQSETNLRWANNSLTTNGQMSSRSITVISFLRAGEQTRFGSVNRVVASAEELTALVAESEAAAAGADFADDVMPLLTPQSPGVAPNSPDFADDPAATDIAVLARFAAGLGAEFAQARQHGQLLYGFAEHQLATTLVASSTGLRLRHVQPTGRVEINAKSLDLARSAWIGAQTRDFTDVDIHSLIAQLSTRLEWAATSVALPAGRYETILPPGAVADLLIDVLWSASSRDAEEGRSVFSAPEGGTRIGERLSPLPLTLRSDPQAVGIGCAPFEVAAVSSAGTSSVFDNGLALHATSWLADGVLANLMRTRSWGAKTGQPARPGIDNLILDGGTATLEEMIASTKRGLLLTCLWYIREVDPQTLLLTGLTRDGVYLIEDGQVVGAVNNFRFNESPIDLLGRVIEVGEAVGVLPREWNDYFTRTIMPPMRIRDFNMSTVSQAS